MSDAPRGAGGHALPLRGRRVIVTRAADQAEDLAALLGALGAEVLACPVLRAELLPALHLAPLRDRLGAYDWILVTSENGVRGLLAQLAELGLDASALAGARTAAVGTGTAAALAAGGMRVDFVPTEFRGEALRREFAAAHRLAGRRILRVRGGRAATDLEDALREAGAEVDALDTYRTVDADPGGDVRADILGRGADAVAFAAGSAVTGFDRALPQHGLHARAVAACIGPVCARAAERAGWRRVVTAAPSTAAGLAAAVASALGG